MSQLIHCELKIKNLQEELIDNGFEFKILHNEWSLSLTG